MSIIKDQPLRTAYSQIWHSYMGFVSQQLSQSKHPQSNSLQVEGSRQLYLRQDMHPSALKGEGNFLSLSYSSSSLRPSPQTGKFDSKSRRAQLSFFWHLSHSISAISIILLENVSFRRRLQSGVRHLILSTMLMGEFAVCIIFPIVISLIDSSGSPQVRQKVETILLMGQLSWDSPWGLDTLMASMLLRIKQTLSINVQKPSLSSLGSQVRSLRFFIKMLEVSKGLPRKIEDLRSCSLNPIPVLALLVKILVSPRTELLFDRLFKLHR